MQGTMKVLSDIPGASGIYSILNTSMILENLLAIYETRLAGNENCLARNEAGLVRNKTRGGNLRLSGTVQSG